MHIQIGLSTFVNTNLQLLDQSRMLIQKDEWEIADNENSQLWSQIFPLMIQSKVQILRLFCTHSNIIREINHIQFTFLTTISLSQCKLVSMESLAKLNAPLLRELEIQMNNLAFIRPFRKCNFPKLISLGITQNYFNELTSLTQCNFPDLRFLSIEYLVLKIMGPEFNWILKMQAKDMNIIRKMNTIKEDWIKEDLIGTSYKIRQNNDIQTYCSYNDINQQQISRIN